MKVIYWERKGNFNVEAESY